MNALRALRSGAEVAGGSLMEAAAAEKFRGWKPKNGKDDELKCGKGIVPAEG